MALVKINKEQRLYVMQCGAGVSCIGFDVADRRGRAVAAWISQPQLMAGVKVGTGAHYAAYQAALEAGRKYAAQTGQRCEAELIPELVGLEGCRVEVAEPQGERRRIIVGRSTGWMPCHLELARRDSIGGSAAFIPEGATVTPLYPVNGRAAA